MFLLKFGKGMLDNSIFWIAILFLGGIVTVAYWAIYRNRKNRYSERSIG